MTAQPKIGAVVVAFHPDGEFEQRLAAIVREVGRVLVVDNTAEPPIQEQLNRACDRQGAEFIANSENQGLGFALNRGFELLAAGGYEAVLAFDQDSKPAPGYAAALLATAREAANAAVIGANWRDEGRPGYASRHLRPHRHLPLGYKRTTADHDLADVTFVITSGSLFRVSAWRALGGFREDLFVDLVDTDYCLRAIAAGYSVRVAAAAKLRHRRAAKRAVRFLGCTFWPAYMSALRLRYLFRNRVRLLARHTWRAPHWAVFEIVHSLKICAEIVFLEPGKLAKLAACARGVWDGVAGRSGRIPEPPPVKNASADQDVR